MYCPKCGRQLPDFAKFCDACGAAVEQVVEAVEAPQAPVTPEPKPVEPVEPKGKKITENIVLGTDGKYHWYFEFKLLKNPTILKLLWKIFFWVFIGIWIFVCIVSACQGQMNFKDFLHASLVFVLVLAGVEALVAISYFIYAALQGFKYCVMFEMDEEGVTHTQMPKQFKKAQAMSFITMMMGAAAGSPGTVGTGLLAASKQAMVSNWSAVKSVEIIRKRDVIKVNERLNKNQVYALPEDFQFVEDFIKSHVTKKCKVYEK